LYASGEGVALGYLNEQNGDAFFVDEALAPGLIYRTGDLVKEDENGLFHFIGRRDSLIKVRGYRVSLEEVRSHIVSLDDVVDAVVLKKDLPLGDQILVAYVRNKEGSAMDTKAIRRRLAGQIPGYMIPSQFVFDDALAITANGKIDRTRILRHLNQGSGTLDRNEQIAATIKAVCRRDELLAGIPEDEDFFDHGVSSLAVIQMQIRIEEALNVTVPTSELMGQPTINAWISLYTGRAGASAEIEAAAGITCGVAQ
jgi:acyl carrier protein